MKKVIVAIMVIMLTTTAHAQTYYLNAVFSNSDLATINASEKIGKTGWNDEFAIFHQITGDLEIGYLKSITDNGDGSSTCQFVYEETKYRPEVNVYEINSWVESLDNTKPLVRSLPQAKIVRVEE